MRSSSAILRREPSEQIGRQMPRVLIVTSMFLPYLAADMHRARLLAAELPKQGWDVEILVPGDAFQNPAHFEPNASLLSIDVPVHRAEPEWQWAFTILRSRSLGAKAYPALRRLGDSLLSSRRFDLVYFSCSQHALFHVGVAWKRRHRVPFVLDLHDPWYSEQLPDANHLPHFRRSFANRVARTMERATLRQAAGLVSVSPEYLATLYARYEGCDWNALRPERGSVIPFGASDGDYSAARGLEPLDVDFGRNGERTIVYTGAGGTIMESSFRTLCRLLLEVRQRAPALLSGVRIQLFGTEELPVGRMPTLARIASEAGLADLVSEYPARVSYLEALRIVLASDGLLVLGIDNSAYNPSKLFLYGASGKPLLACLRAGSVVDEYFSNWPELGHLVHFGEARLPDIGPVLAFLSEVTESGASRSAAGRHCWLAAEMARRHAELFQECLRNPNGEGAVASP